MSLNHYCSKPPFLPTLSSLEVPWVKCGSILRWDLAASALLPHFPVPTLCWPLSSVIQTPILFQSGTSLFSNCYWILRLMILYTFYFHKFVEREFLVLFSQLRQHIKVSSECRSFSLMPSSWQMLSFPNSWDF